MCICMCDILYLYGCLGGKVYEKVLNYIVHILMIFYGKPTLPTHPSVPHAQMYSVHADKFPLVGDPWID